MTQREALAYGHPDFGGVVFGGSNAGTYSLMGWSVEDTLETRTVRATVAVHGEADIEPVLAALGRQSGNLGITVGRATKVMSCTTSIPAALGNGAQEVTLIRQSGSTFAASDIGLPIELEGGTMAQIARVSTANLAIANIAEDLDFSYGAEPIEVRIGVSMVNCRDSERATAHFDQVKVGGVAARTSISRPGDADDDQGRRLFEFTAVFQRPAAEARGDDDARPHVRRARVERVTAESELLTLTFSGEITAGVDSSGDGQKAYNLLSEAIDSWISGQLTELANGRTFDDVTGDRVESWDDEGAVLTFRRTKREINFPDLNSAANDARIRGANVRMSRVYRNFHGIRRGRTPYSVAINYSASVAAAGANAVTYENLPDLWGNTIKPFLIERAKALFGGTPIVLSGGDPDLDPVASRISASMLVFMAGAGSNVYSYARRTRMGLSEEVDLARIHDGQAHTYVGWSPGQQLVGTVDISVVQVGRPSRLQGTGGNPLGGVGVFGGGPLSITGLDAGIFGAQGAIGSDAAGVASPNDYESYPTPGDPARLFGGATPNDGRWLILRRDASESPTFWGQDPDGAGNIVEINSLSFSAVYLYTRKELRRDPPIPRQPTQPGLPGRDGPAGSIGLSSLERNPLGGE